MVQTINSEKPKYTGQKQPKPGEKYKNITVYPYFPSEELVEAVNLAIILERPLLIKGKPGCGKTELAGAVAYELGLPYEAWHVKSTSRAQDGLYTYDHLLRLHDVHSTSPKPENAHSARSGQELKHEKYITYGPLGKAFGNKNERTVVLIDEIDKADIDFPNDLLLELDKHQFKIKETDKTIEAKHRPIVFITSNDEKELPEAFLRRCLFHYIKFPNREQLIKIINERFETSDDELVEEAVKRFETLRNEMEDDKGKSRKNVSTSELIDWFDVLRRNDHDEVLAMLDGKLPYPSVLLKSWDDHRRYLKRGGT